MSEFQIYAARALFASAWADLQDEQGTPCRGEILDAMPDAIDPAALHAARTLQFDVERANGATVDAILERIATRTDGDRPPTMEFFGHYCAMQAMGHGVGLRDAFGSGVADSIRVPYVEFGSHSLERDYP